MKKLIAILMALCLLSAAFCLPTLAEPAYVAEEEQAAEASAADETTEAEPDDAAGDVAPATAASGVDVLVAEPWRGVGGDARLILNADGSAVLESNVNIEGTWAYTEPMMTFSYELYGPRTLNLILSEVDGVWRLTTEDGQGMYLPESQADAAKAAANANLNAYPIELGTPIELPFATITFDHAEVTGMVGSNEMYHTYITAASGMKFMALKGTIANTANIEINAEHVRGEMVFDDNYTYTLSAKTDIARTGTVSFDSIGAVPALTSCDYYIYAQIPENLVGNFTTCRVTFAFNDNFSGTPNYMADGDFVFTIDIDEDASAAAQQGPVRELTYFEECPILPVPTSYVDVRESSHNSSKSNGRYTSISYTYRPLLDGDKIADLCAQYLQALRDAGYTVSEKGGETTVSAGGKQLVTITLDGDAMKLAIKPGNQDLHDLPTPGAAAEPEPETASYRLGDTVTAHGGQVVLQKMTTTDRVYSDLTGTARWYSYYDSTTGEPLLAVLGEFKNTGSEPVDVNNIYAAFIIDGNLSYRADVCGVKSGANNFIRDVAPMASTQIYVYGEVPKSVIQNAKSIVVKLGFTDNFDYRFTTSGGLPMFDRCDEVFEIELLGAPSSASNSGDASDGSSASGVDPLTEYTDKATVKAVQQALNDAGYPCGTPDGAAGKKTKAAIKDYQKDHGLNVTGTITHELLVSLGLAEGDAAEAMASSAAGAASAETAEIAIEEEAAAAASSSERAAETEEEAAERAAAEAAERGDAEAEERAAETEEEAAERAAAEAAERDDAEAEERAAETEEEAAERAAAEAEAAAPARTAEFVVYPGSEGEQTVEVLKLAAAMGFIKKLPAKETAYADKYTDAVIQLEEALGLDADGSVTADEYAVMAEIIYAGKTGDDVRALLELLADLGDITTLPENHDTYDAKFVTQVKKAETKYGLDSDGVITAEERAAIESQPVPELGDVTGFNLTARNGVVSLSWKAVKGAVRYDVYRGNSCIATTTKTSYKDEDAAQNDTNAYYVVPRKYTVDGRKSDTKDVFVDAVFVKTDLVEICKDPEAYKGKFVKISGVKKVNTSWEGPFNLNLAMVVQKTSGDRNYYACFIFEEYISWNWNGSKDLLQVNPNSIIGEGQVIGTREYEDRGPVPVIVLQNVNWS